MPDGHGGKVWDGDGKRLAVLDFSSSLWPPPAWPQALLQRSVLEAYPDADCRGLERAAARWYGVGEQNVLAANGSTEALYLLMRALAPAQLTIFEPTFSEYERAARWGLAPGRPRMRRGACGAEDNFRPVLEVPGSDGMVVLCNPNNPTGGVLPRDELKWWLTACAAAGVWVLVDEAFMEFVEGGGSMSVVPWLRKFPHLLVLRSMTKWMGIAGLRLGFLLGRGEVIKRVRSWRIPWSVNGAAQQVGQWLLKSPATADRLAGLPEVVSRERRWLTSRLEGLEWRVYPSAANFVLCRLPPEQVQGRLLEGLRQRGILLRDASNFRGLGPGYVRCAVRPRTENRQLVTALEACR